MTQKFGHFEILPPFWRNASTPWGKIMILTNLAQYVCVAHEMKGIQEGNTLLTLKFTFSPSGGRNRPFSNMAAVVKYQN